MGTSLQESQPPVPALEIQMLRLYATLLDEDRTQSLLDYAQELIEEQRAEHDSTTTVAERDSAATA